MSNLKILIGFLSLVFAFSLFAQPSYAVVRGSFAEPGAIGKNRIYTDTINREIDRSNLGEVINNTPTDPDQKFGYKLQDTKTSFDFGEFHVDIKLFCNDDCSNHRKKVKGTAEKYAQEAYADGEKIIPKQSCSNSYYVVRVTNRLGFNSPTGLTPSCSVSGDSVNFSWNSVTGATYYKVSVNDTKDGWNESSAGSSQYPGDRFSGNVTGTSWSTGIIKDDTYSWWVSSCNEVGCANPSYGPGFNCGSGEVNENDAICGSANGTVTQNPPTNNLCSKGTPSSVNSTQYVHSWTCYGVDNGRDQSCSASTGKNPGDGDGDGNGGNGGGNNDGSGNAFLEAEIDPSVVSSEDDQCYISWTTQNAISCMINNSFVPTASDGFGVSPGEYTLTCSNESAQSESESFVCLLNPAFKEF